MGSREHPESGRTIPFIFSVSVICNPVCVHKKCYRFFLLHVEIAWQKCNNRLRLLKTLHRRQATRVHGIGG